MLGSSEGIGFELCVFLGLITARRMRMGLSGLAKLSYVRVVTVSVGLLYQTLHVGDADDMTHEYVNHPCVEYRHFPSRCDSAIHDRTGSSSSWNSSSATAV